MRTWQSCARSSLHSRPDRAARLREAPVLAHCRLCPRACGADRLSGRTGWCGAGAMARVARAALHHGEEPPLSGTRGSGTVFFSRCNLRCCFCQNHEISWGGKGRDLSEDELAAIFLDLQAQGAHNINLVSPTPYAPQIAAALRAARAAGLTLPVVYNTNAYELPSTLHMLRGLVDIFLPDLKYADDRLAAEYSAGPGYFSAAAQAILTMRRLAPRDLFAPDGTMLAGLIVRHLVLPGQHENTRLVWQWIARNLGPGTYVSAMAQYTPCFHAAGHAELGRTLTPGEYERALSALDATGLTNGFIQDLSAASTAYTPVFDLTGVLKIRGR